MTGTTQLHSYSAQFPEPFQLPLQVLVSSQLSLSLCLSFRCQMDKQSIIRHFCSISFNTGLLCSILLSICILKSHGSLLLVDSYTGCGSWLLYGESYMYTGCGSCNTRKVICHPCHNPAFHIQDKPQCVDCTILSSLQH